MENEYFRVNWWYNIHINFELKILEIVFWLLPNSVVWQHFSQFSLRTCARIKKSRKSSALFIWSQKIVVILWYNGINGHQMYVMPVLRINGSQNDHLSSHIIVSSKILCIHLPKVSFVHLSLVNLLWLYHAALAKYRFLVEFWYLEKFYIL